MHKEVIHISRATATFAGGLKAYASEKNPLQTIAEIVITPFSVNKNGQAIPRSETENIATSALNQPLKINFAGNKVNGHSGSIPIGSITDVQIEDDRIVGKAVIWNDEFPAIAEHLKSASASGKDEGTSWEIYFAESTFENGVEYLHGCVYAACCVVENPAYGTETLIRAIASDLSKSEEVNLEEEREEILSLQDQLESLYTLLDDLWFRSFEIEEAQQTRSDNLDTFSQRLQSLFSRFQELEAEYASAKAEKEKIVAERDALLIEKQEAEKKQRLAERLNKLGNTSDEDLKKLAETLDDDAFELVVKSITKNKQASAETKDIIIPEPALRPEKSIKELHAEALKSGDK